MGNGIKKPALGDAPKLLTIQLDQRVGARRLECVAPHPQMGMHGAQQVVEVSRCRLATQVVLKPRVVIALHAQAHVHAPPPGLPGVGHEPQVERHLILSHAHVATEAVRQGIVARHDHPRQAALFRDGRIRADLALRVPA